MLKIINKSLQLLKKIPIDLAQEKMAKITKGKLIALSLVGQGKGKIVLDVGCREGYWSEILKQSGFRVISIDKEKMYKDCQRVDVNKGLPFEDFTFDIVWATEVLEHLNSPKDSIKEFNRVMKLNGKLILTTPNSYFFLMKLFHWLGIKPNKLQNIGHKHFFNLRDIKILFPHASIFGYFPYCIIKFKIKKLVGLLSPTFIIEKKKENISNHYV